MCLESWCLRAVNESVLDTYSHASGCCTNLTCRTIRGVADGKDFSRCFSHSTESLLQEQTGFERGSIQSYELQVGQRLGSLKRVSIQQVEESITVTGVGWYLDRIEIAGPDGETWSFPCGAWFGKSDAGDFVGEFTLWVLLVCSKDVGTMDACQHLNVV
jgi:PLAT/LH2 domain